MVKKLSNFGIQGENTRFKGDHYITLKLQTPKVINEEQRYLFTKLLCLQ